MCMACEEMNLYYAYLDAIEEAKRRAQPWQCEVTILPQADSAQDDAQGRPAQPAKAVAAATDAGAAGFACDDPE